MEIHVKREHIEKGIRNDIHYCPISRAVKDELGLEGCDVTTGEFIQIKNGESPNKWKRYYHTPESKLFMRDFDDGNPVNEFVFELGHPYQTRY